MTFQKAVKRQAKLKAAVTGPSGSGKTLSALLIAKGLANGGKIAVVDTENRSASLYAGPFVVEGKTVNLDFDTCEIEAPFTVEKYKKALDEAVSDGYSVVVIDSLTHEWAGSGGLLDQKELLDQRGRGNTYTNWATITKQHEAFKEALLQADIHVIAAMRSKQEYILQDKDGKQVPKKVGMSPIQRDGMEYEFTTVIDMAMNHTAEVSKDRTGLFDGKIFKPCEETGVQLRTWLESGEVQLPKPSPVPSQKDNIPAHEGKTKTAFEKTQDDVKKLLNLGEEILSALRSRNMKQNAAISWCESKGWDIEAIRHELAMDITTTPEQLSDPSIKFG